MTTPPMTPEQRDAYENWFNRKHADRFHALMRTYLPQTPTPAASNNVCGCGHPLAHHSTPGGCSFCDCKAWWASRQNPPAAKSEPMVSIPLSVARKASAMLGSGFGTPESMTIDAAIKEATRGT